MANRVTIDRISRNDDFQAYAAAGRPVVVVDEVKHWKSHKRWTLPYLRSVLAHRQDFAVVEKRMMSFCEFADKLESSQSDVWAPQLSLTGRAENSGLGTAYELLPDLEYPTVLDRSQLDEINVWIGRGSTPLHLDGYDNLLAVIRGTKHVSLLEPEWFEDVYIRKSQWSSADIDNRDLESFPRLAAVPEPLNVCLEEGEMLYLPAHWLHQVGVPHGYAVTLNYWYRCQHGVDASGYGSYFYMALVNMLRLFGDLNPVEKQLAACRLRDVVNQIADGHSPLPQKARTWSGGQEAFSRFRV